MQNLKGNYEQRVVEKKEDAKKTELIAKKLEVEEAMLLQRLQKTY